MILRFKATPAAVALILISSPASPLWTLLVVWRSSWARGKPENVVRCAPLCFHGTHCASEYKHRQSRPKDVICIEILLLGIFRR